MPANHQQNERRSEVNCIQSKLCRIPKYKMKCDVVNEEELKPESPIPMALRNEKLVGNDSLLLC